MSRIGRREPEKREGIVERSQTALILVMITREIRIKNFYASMLVKIVVHGVPSLHNFIVSD